MFKFNFFSDNKQEDETEIHQNKTEWITAKEIIPEDNNSKTLPNNVEIFKYSKDKQISYVSYNFVLNRLKESACILQTEREHSDLLPAIYEGGLKIWECTYDLVDFIQDINFENKRVLDLGCGSGIVGISALLNNASEVYFQDYNEEVITNVTIPNVYLNNNKNQQVKFYSGDWKTFAVLINIQFDYILTSETIYNPDNYHKLINLFKKLLVRNGKVYLAAKTCYFGVGGSLQQFQHEIVKDKIFKFKICWKCTNGIQREIIELTI